MTTTVIKQAQREVRAVLKRYRVTWDQVAPDRDLETWKTIRPVARRIRGKLFRKYYPSLQ